MGENGRMRRRVGPMIAAVALVAAGCSYTPTEVIPEIPANAESSMIFASDGTLIHTLHGEENRVEVPLASIPLVLQHAVIAIEDERFYEHVGVDIRAIFRALQKNAEVGTTAQGGSTITQQLVKNTLLNSGKTIDRKIQEASLAWQLEQHYSKQRILEVYLNTIYFGNGAYGVQAAAHTYFSKDVGQVSVTEAAMIAGLIQSPSDDEPLEHPEAATARRNVVLDKMLELGFITQDERDFAVASPTAVAPTPPEDRYPAAHFVEEVKRFILTDPRFGPTREAREHLLFNGGLRIRTTIDLRLQAAAEGAVASVLDDPSDPEAALVAVEPGTGYVKAMVGGRDYFGTAPTAKYNLAMGKGRPTGSAFKPFVLAAALEEDIPLSESISAPGCIDLNPPTGPWHVCNADPGEGAPGGTNLIEGTVHSFNTLYAQLVLQVGPNRAVEEAKRLGVTPPNGLAAFPSAVLGSNDVRPLDMADAYATFANRGVQVPPTMVTKITRADGSVVYEAPHTQTKALDERVNADVTSVLEQVIVRGTGKAAQLDRPAAGKTGTGEEYKDAWFCGYAPQLATAVWVGFPEAGISMSRGTTRITVYGGTWPAQIWQRFMTDALVDVPPTPFPEPPTTTTTTAPPPGARREVAVPPVVGLPLDQAVAVLQSQGFVVRQSAVRDYQFPAGYVRAQAPAAGLDARGGSTATIEISTGAPQTLVPNVIGLFRDEAVEKLRAAGFVANIIEQKPPPEGDGKDKDNKLPPGIVWEQSPRGGNAVPPSSAITIVVVPP
jgi:penicillin-binding protein 1A